MTLPKATSYSKGVINKAGEVLITNESDESALNILGEWRACHAYPINTFQKTLRDRISKLKLQENTIVAQRLKRMPTIIDKLKRYPKMKLSQMQDIGGVRAVVNTVGDVRALVENYKNKDPNSRFEHKLLREKDYISNPRSEDGYRSVHLIYEYKNRVAPQYNGLFLEMQIRTKLQHTWATAVETMGIYLNQPLKSRIGEQKWIDYFALVSSAFAHQEKLPLVPRYAHLSERQTFEAIRAADKELQVLEKLSGFAVAANLIKEDKRKGFYRLIILNTKERSVNVQSYAKINFEKAKLDYSEIEKRAAMGESLEPVLVAVGSISLLQKAYPNFFLDTTDFVRRVARIIVPRRGATGEI